MLAICGVAGTLTAVSPCSRELPEVINLSTRILVLRGGRIVGDVARAQATQSTLMRLMAGIPAQG
jgi:ribose transport system ATP-binding protein